MSKKITVKRRSLPNKPSKILQIALEDLRAVKAMPGKFQINMNTWLAGKHNFKNHKGQKCEVCHAGAVMVCSLGKKVGTTENVSPSDFSRKTEAKLEFINNVREGSIVSGLEDLKYAGVISEGQYIKAVQHLGEDGWGMVGGVEINNDTDVPFHAAEYQVGYRKQYEAYIEGVIGVFKAIGL